MQDIFKKYKKHKIISNLGVVAASLVMAFGINFLLLDGTNIGKQLTASVLNSSGVQVSSDIFIDKDENGLLIKTSKDIKDIKSLSFSLTYNPENVEIIEINNPDVQITELSNEPGITSLIISYKEAVTLEENSSVVSLSINKREEKTEHINMLNANFKDLNGENYLLSTSGFTF